MLFLLSSCTGKKQESIQVTEQQKAYAESIYQFAVENEITKSQEKTEFYLHRIYLLSSGKNISGEKYLKLEYTQYTEAKPDGAIWSDGSGKVYSMGMGLTRYYSLSYDTNNNAISINEVKKLPFEDSILINNTIAFVQWKGLFEAGEQEKSEDEAINSLYEITQYL